jgi:hypothetical protein
VTAYEAVFTMPIRAFTIPIRVFTMRRSWRSRWSDPRVHDRPKPAVRVDSLKWWRWELARRAANDGPRLLPVVVEPAPARRAEPAASDIEVVVEAGAVRVSVRGAISLEHLAVLMGAVSRTC